MVCGVYGTRFKNPKVNIRPNNNGNRTNFYIKPFLNVPDLTVRIIAMPAQLTGTRDTILSPCKDMANRLKS